jgi:hypothetical protein
MSASSQLTKHFVVGSDSNGEQTCVSSVLHSPVAAQQSASAVQVCVQ